jgi:hypothetical protein
MENSGLYPKTNYAEKPFSNDRQARGSLVDKVAKWHQSINKWRGLVSVIFLLGLGTGIYRYQTFIPLTSTYLVANSNYLSRENVQVMIEGLQNHVNSQHYDYLSSLLDMEKEAVQTLKTLHCQFVPRNEDKALFRLNIKASSAEYFPQFEKAIFNYIENLDYVKRNIQGEKERVEMSLANLSTAYLRLDSMEQLLRIDIEKKSGRLLNENRSINEGVTAYAEIINQKLMVNERQFRMKKELNRLSNFEIIQGFDQYANVIQPSVLKLFLPPLGLAILMCFFVIYLLELRVEVLQRNRIKRI